MPFYNSRNSNFVMKFRKNCDIDLYFGNIFLQFPINIDFCQGAPQIHFDRPPPPSNYLSPTLGTVALESRGTPKNRTSEFKKFWFWTKLLHLYILAFGEKKSCNLFPHPFL